jgi:Fe-S oxidoreductase
MTKDSTHRWFRDDLCDRCGKCLADCPVLMLPEACAKKEFAALLENNYTQSLAFRYCTTCNICDQICPQNANPYELILERFDAEKTKNGLPSFAKLVFPGEPENIWSGLRILMDKDELAIVEAGELNLSKKQSEILLTGFYANIVPFLLKSEVLDDLRPAIAGSPMMWGCGGDSNKLGAITLTEEIVKFIERKFSEMGVKKVICSMEAEAAMLAEVLPERYGAKFDFEVTTLDEWLLDRMKNGKLKMDKSLSLKVTVHDNCMSRYLGGRPQEVVREIVQRTGCELVEMKHNRDKALCCGWAATIPALHGPKSNNPLNTTMSMLYSLDRRMREALDTGADVIAASCPACYIFLNLIKELTGADIQIRHPLELIGMARGETLSNMGGRRSWEMLAVAANLMHKWSASRSFRKRFTPRLGDVNASGTLPALLPGDAARIRKYAKLLSGPLVNNRLSRRSIIAATKIGIALYARRVAGDLGR